MRVPRIKEAAGGYYHVISRIVDRRMVLDQKEKERFRGLMRRVAMFSDIQILTYAVLDNHFHILLHVPPSRAVSDEELGVRLGALYNPTVAHNLTTHLAMLREEGQDEAAECFKCRYTHRMYELSEFVKTLKQRFSQSFNARHRRKGTLWEERFKSVLVQGEQGALSAIAAYIDLNAVRAGIVGDPRDYRFSGYGEAVGGSSVAREGLAVTIQTLGVELGWGRVHAEYRKLLYVVGQERGILETGGPHRVGFSREVLQHVLDTGGTLTVQQALHCRVRYFTDGLVLGSQVYVDDAFRRYRNRFSLKRRTGARRMPHLELGDLFMARRLRLRTVMVPTG